MSRKPAHLCAALVSCRELAMQPGGGWPCWVHRPGWQYERKRKALEKLLAKRGVKVTLIEESSEFTAWYWNTKHSRGQLRLYKPKVAE